MSGLEKLVESFNEVLQVLDKDLIDILFSDKDLKGNEEKFLYLQYTDVDEFTLYYDDEFGDGLNVELFKLDIEDILTNRAVILSLIGLMGGMVDEIEEEVLEAISKFIDLATIELDRVRSNEALKELLLDQEKQGVN